MATKRPTSSSYFVGVLAEQARSDTQAAPFELSDLISKLRYLTPQQIAEIREACKYAERAHEGQTRKTGHSYITHPLAVAGILAELEADHETVMAGVLHDVIEDCNVTKETLETRFGIKVANIVDGVTKLAEFSSTQEFHATNIQSIALATVKDPRVIVVKLADRLHNMRTLAVIDKDKRLAIATETLEIYAPIAQRLGIYVIKNELEDLAFAAKNSFRSDHITYAVERFENANEDNIRVVQSRIQAHFNEIGLDASINYHSPHLYAIYHKMKHGPMTFDEAMTFLNFRVLTHSTEDCYRALGAVHQVFKPNTRGFHDYIAARKHNGYQSLHTQVIGPRGKLTKIQIRTLQMEEFAKRGITTIHPNAMDTSVEGLNEALMKSFADTIEDIQDHADNAIDFVAKFKHDLVRDRILVYTPDGDVIHLPIGATVIDFAYSISTTLGAQCTGSYVDNQPAPLSTVLETGQTVDVQTEKSSMPSPAWLDYAITPRARNAIKRQLDRSSHSLALKTGQRLLDAALAQAGVTLEDLDFRSHRKVYKDLNVKHRNELLLAVGRGQLQPRFAAMKLLSSVKDETPSIYLEDGLSTVEIVNQKMNATFANCCGPVPGDQIVGHGTRQKGFVVHRRACATARSDKKADRVPLTWGDTNDEEFSTGLMIWVTGEKDSIYKLASALRLTDASLMRMDTLPEQGITNAVRVEIKVRNSDHLKRVSSNLRRSHFVAKVQRLGNRADTEE